MKYMLLTYYNQDFAFASFANERPEEVRELIEFMRQLNADLEAAGELAYAEGLADPSETKTVRPEGGDAVTTDGPYAEAKEVLAGFWVVDVPSFDRAAEIAARIRALRQGADRDPADRRGARGLAGGYRLDTERDGDSARATARVSCRESPRFDRI